MMFSSLRVEVKGEPPFEVLLDRDLIGVGRAEDNALGLRDMNVSRHHFAIERRSDGTYYLHDRGSRNGTVVNGVAVLDKVLGNGDRITVGASVLTFLVIPTAQAIAIDDAPKPRPAAGALGSSVSAAQGLGVEPPPSSPATPAPFVPPASAPPPPAPPGRGSPAPAGAEAAWLRGVTGRAPLSPPGGGKPLLPDATPSPRPATPAVGQPRPLLRPTTPPQGIPRPPPASPTPAPAPRAPTPKPPGTLLPAISETPRHRWRRLADAAAAINREHDLTTLLDRIVDGVLALVPAKSAYLILREGDGLRVAVARGEADDSDEPVERRFSRTVANDAIASRKPILTRDAVEDTAFGEVHSIVDLKLRAILCVPFSSAEGALGVVYLDEPACELEGPNADEVTDLVAAFGDLAGIAVANARHLAEVRDRERLQEELRIAVRIQRKLLPAGPPDVPGLELAGATLPAVEVGGDLYDFVAMREQLFVSIGDVSGKGVGAGIVMATVRALLRAYAETESATDRLVIAMNRALARDLEAGCFVSFLLVRYDGRSGALRYTGAGHEHLILIRASGKVELLRTGGVVLGLVPDLTGKVEEKTLVLGRGDLVVLYTDGATEAIDPAGAELGLERLAELVRGLGHLPARDVVDAIVRAVRQFQGGRDPTDDLTVVAFRRR